MKQIAKLPGWIIILENDQYIAYRKWWANRGWHRKKIATFADMRSCLFFIAQNY